MTRVVNGIYDDVELDTGFFISDKETDLIASWLTCYADALEAAWKRANPKADPKTARGAKFRQVRSFISAVARKRGTSAAPLPQIPSKTPSSISPERSERRRRLDAGCEALEAAATNPNNPNNPNNQTIIFQNTPLTGNNKM